MTAEPLAEGPYDAAGSGTVLPVSSHPRVRWVRPSWRTRDGEPPSVSSDLVVAAEGLVVVNVAYSSNGYPDVGPGRYAVLDPDDGLRRFTAEEEFRGVVGGIAVGVGPSGDAAARCLLTGALTQAPAAPAMGAPAPSMAYDGTRYQTRARAAAVSYHASGSTVTAQRDADGAQLWTFDVAELLRLHLRQDDEYPPDLGDGGFGLLVMVPTPGRLYLLTSGYDVICLEASDGDERQWQAVVREPRRPASIALDDERAAMTGYQYCSSVQLVAHHGIAATALLCGSRPYTAQDVYEELSARGYPVIRVQSRDGWMATLGGYWFETYLVLVDRWDRGKWYTVVTDRWVVFHRRHGCWLKWWHRESDDDDDRFLYVSRDQAARIAEVFGARLPARAVLDQIDDDARRDAVDGAGHREWRHGRRPGR